ncbi:hypothetical protein K501DRAFT_271911 [Backusella circina FSU 941]|nr:hypothetical protein K501DRAFT_271911 [Backusella circina FSU 941]
MSYPDSLSASWSHRPRDTESSRYASSSRQGGYRAPMEENSNISATSLNKTLSKLIDRFKISSTDPQQKKEILLHEYSTLILRFFDIVLHFERVPSIVENENDVVNTIRKRLHQRDSRNSEKAYRFGHLYNKLASQQILTKKWSTLYFLLLTMDTSPISSPGLQHIDQNAYLQPPVSRPYDMPHDSPRNTRRRLEREPPQLSPSLSTDPPAIQLARARESRKHEYSSLSQFSSSISESVLLRDLIFIFQGIDGQYIKFDSTTNGYTILDVGLSTPTKELVYKLSEIGWLYNQVRGFIDKNIDTPSIGLVAQSFCAALQHELVEYYKLIAILEAQIEKQMTSAGVNGLSLKKLFIWTLETQQRLKLMSILVDACQGEKGGALISIMHNYTKHGDPFINRYIIEILQERKFCHIEVEEWSPSSITRNLLACLRRFYGQFNTAFSHKRRNKFNPDYKWNWFFIYSEFTCIYQRDVHIAVPLIWLILTR